MFLKSSRVPERLFTIVMWLVSLVFAVFLIGLGRQVITDLPRLDEDIRLEQFIDEAPLARIDKQLQALDAQQLATRRSLEQNDLALTTARNNYASAQATFNNWLKTRRATADASQDPEVLERTALLDILKEEERKAQRAAEELRLSRAKFNNQQSDLREERRDLSQTARPAFERARFVQDLKVFALRLGFTLPLLVLSGWFIAKKRKSEYWPLMRGFVIASLFAFFVELVPYLPSYGGYIRYSVGIVLTLVAGHFTIRNMRAYLARRKAEETEAEEERRKRVPYEEAFKKMSSDICPGCDRPVSTTGDAEANFCVHCGMTLFDHCMACNTRKLAFYRFCMSCGAPGDANQQSSS